ncbi:MAG: hypothetical protein ACLFV3_03290 [Phycisphaeraceae bacterium]
MRLTTGSEVRGRRGLRAALLLTAAAMLAGCAGRTAPPPDLPTLGELRSRVTPVERPPETVVPNPGGPMVAVVNVRELAVPLDSSLEEAWSLVDQSVLSRMAREVWAENGLRVGVIPRSKMADFAERLPEVLATRPRRLTFSDWEMPLHEGPTLRGRVAEVTLARGASARQIRGGRLRLLASAQTARQGMALDLLPQHYTRDFAARLEAKKEDAGDGKLTREQLRELLLPRHPMMQEHDGRIFDELGIRLTTEETQVIVLALAPPEPEEEQKASDPGGAGDDEASGDAEEDESEQEDESNDAKASEQSPPRMVILPPREQRAGGGRRPAEAVTQAQAGRDERAKRRNQAGQPKVVALPPNLGRWLLTRRREGSPTQSVLLIRVSPIR